MRQQSWPAIVNNFEQNDCEYSLTFMQHGKTWSFHWLNIYWHRTKTKKTTSADKKTLVCALTNVRQTHPDLMVLFKVRCSWWCTCATRHTLQSDWFSHTCIRWGGWTVLSPLLTRVSLYIDDTYQWGNSAAYSDFFSVVFHTGKYFIKRWVHVNVNQSIPPLNLRMQINIHDGPSHNSLIIA